MIPTLTGRPTGALGQIPGQILGQVLGQILGELLGVFPLSFSVITGSVSRAEGRVSARPD